MSFRQGIYKDMGCFSERILCGQNYVLDDGVLTSSNYPKFYENMVSCVWVISIDGGEGEAITFIFTDMDLEEDEQCRYDYIEVRLKRGRFDLKSKCA